MQALNAPQHVYSYPPHRPTLLRKWMPDNNDKDITWKWIKKALPNITETASIYDFVNVLAKPSPYPLTTLESPDPKFKSFHTVFKQELSALSQAVKSRKHEYNYLDPEKIACSIDI